MRLVSPAIAAAVTAFFALRLQVIAHDRAKATVRALQIIADLNHHIRNALQVISYENYANAEPNKHMREAVERIEWTLREILPGFNHRLIRACPGEAHAKRTEGR